MDIVIVDDQSSARTMLRNIVQGIDRHLDVHDFGEARVALENERLSQHGLAAEATGHVGHVELAHELADALARLGHAPAETVTLASPQTVAPAGTREPELSLAIRHYRQHELDQSGHG